jgi:TfoX/Sxy family transcriptional regulator of competence genes
MPTTKTNAKSQKSKRAMPKFTKAPEENVRLFENAMKDFPMMETRKMFGYPAAFINGQMVSGLFGDGMMMRLSEQDRAKFISEFKTKLFEPMPGRPMREYVSVPPSVLKSPKQLSAWLTKAMEYTKSLPPKKAKR